MIHWKKFDYSDYRYEHQVSSDVQFFFSMQKTDLSSFVN